ncbi:MAG: bifunctional tetrahydrofolate synthase/dihydrofolate synthase [Betaproteobacteria bacterium]|nr:bifunctional tetrahydrofolate synthase/dihydrofolate synthase [Betaproteobacteria bacterium]
MSRRTLAGWLVHIERVHPKSIALGLDRVVKVRDALGFQFDGPIITVGGTNGKGSTCAMLEAILLAAGYRVGQYTSPHLLRYNERVRVDGQPLDDAALCNAFEQVEIARGSVQLTYFEFGTLAAWAHFAGAKPDCLILEIGLGGRLDAVNAFDADCAVLTSIDIDHVDFLGDTREQIGAEKAGIFRGSKPAIVADPVPPLTVLEHAAAVKADLQLFGRDFGYQSDPQQWLFWGRGGRRGGLAYPGLRGANQLLNACASLAALDALRGRIPVASQDVRNGFARVELPARFQVLPGRPVVVLDVAHNPHAAAVLAQNLSNMGFFSRTWAVFGMLSDKDRIGVCLALKGRVDHWLAASLTGARGSSAGELCKEIEASGAGGTIEEFDSPRRAYLSASARAGENDRIIVFGSFHTVAEIMAVRSRPTGYSGIGS